MEVSLLFSSWSICWVVVVVVAIVVVDWTIIFWNPRNDVLDVSVLLYCEQLNEYSPNDSKNKATEVERENETIMSLKRICFHELMTRIQTKPFSISFAVFCRWVELQSLKLSHSWNSCILPFIRANILLGHFYRNPRLHEWKSAISFI